MTNKFKIILLSIFLSNLLGKNNNRHSILLSFPNSIIHHEFNFLNNNRFSLFNGIRPLMINSNGVYNITYNYQAAFNVGHPNIDNNAEFFALNGLNNLFSVQFAYNNKWLTLFLEPYTMKYGKNIIGANNARGSYKLLNNHYFNNANQTESTFGFRQSGIIIHYHGVGLGYLNSSQWWGPGFHSSITITSNPPGMGSYVLGTFRDINTKYFLFGIRAVLLPYKNQFDWPIYFSGLSSHITFKSNPNITIGFFRTYLSGNLIDLSTTTSLKRDWTAMDAFKLIFEPLFGQTKSGLEYTTQNTPGFDPWDEVLSGFINLTFPDENLKLYLEVASDDNRANITDLKAHWDHTLGYLLGFRKYYSFGNRKIFVGGEYLSTKKSNTEKFWRMYTNNYFAREVFDFSSYMGRKIGAHSGSNSDDLIFMLGIDNNKSTILFSYNKERHGIKTFLYPEQKNEISLTFSRNISTHHIAFITLEYEHIQNYGFIKGNISESKFLWIGYSFSIN